MQLFAGLFLDGSRVGLERLNLIGKLGVFLLQSADLTLQRLQLGALLSIDDHAVCPKHGMD